MQLGRMGQLFVIVMGQIVFCDLVACGVPDAFVATNVVEDFS